MTEAAEVSLPAEEKRKKPKEVKERGEDVEIGRYPGLRNCSASSTSCWVQHRGETVGERPHRRRWRKHLHDVGHGPRLGSRPAAEGKREHAVGEYESRLAVCADDHGAIGQRLEVGSPGLAVAAAVDAAPAPQAFGREPSIALDGTQR